MRKILILGVSFFLVVGVAQAQEGNRAKQAAVRSLFLPGWGQFYNEQATKGYLIAGAEVVSLGLGVVLWQQANQTYNDYEAKGSKDDPLYDDYKKELSQANLCFYFAGAVWAYNVVDAYISGKKKEAVGAGLPAQGRPVGLKFGLNKDRIELTYRYIF